MPSDDRRGEILGAVITVTMGATIAMALRIFVRLRMVKMLAWDDIVMLAATLICMGAMVIVVIEVHYGHGQHFTALTPRQMANGLFFNFMSSPVYLAATFLVKVSIGLFLLRIAPGKWYKGVIWAVTAVNVIFGVMAIVEVCFQCTDIRVLWDQSVKSSCLPPSTLQTMSYLFQAVNIMTDFFFALLPIPMLWHVQINSKTKASICAILSLGVFACAASIVKVVYIGNYKPGPNYLYDATDLTIWVAVEVNMGIIAGCLPSLKPLFSKLLASTLRSRSTPYGRSSKTGRKYALGNSSTGGWSIGKPPNAIPLQDRPVQPSGPREWFDQEAGTGFNDSEENLTGSPNSSFSPAGVTKSTTITVAVETMDLDKSDRKQKPTAGSYTESSYVYGS